jgi:hypothetical protein
MRATLNIYVLVRLALEYVIGSRPTSASSDRMFFSLYGFSAITSETFRLAKFNRDEAVRVDLSVSVFLMDIIDNSHDLDHSDVASDL